MTKFEPMLDEDLLKTLKYYLHKKFPERNTAIHCIRQIISNIPCTITESGFKVHVCDGCDVAGYNCDEFVKAVK